MVFKAYTYPLPSSQLGWISIFENVVFLHFSKNFALHDFSTVNTFLKVFFHFLYSHDDIIDVVETGCCEFEKYLVLLFLIIHKFSS